MTADASQPGAESCADTSMPLMFTVAVEVVSPCEEINVMALCAEALGRVDIKERGRAARWLYQVYGMDGQP